MKWKIFIRSLGGEWLTSNPLLVGALCNQGNPYRPINRPKVWHEGAD